jgi:hypothetical protein
VLDDLDDLGLGLALEVLPHPVRVVAELGVGQEPLEVAAGVEVLVEGRRLLRQKLHRMCTSGRGLLLMEALAARWGHEPAGSGLLLWFEFDA